MVSIQGEVEEIIFRNDINGYTVWSLSQEQGPVTVIGHMVSISVGETIKAEGTWVEHPLYGQQFKADKCEKELPKTESALIKFLGSGMIKGIREATARKIVDKFGEDSLDIIRNEPHRLSEIKGMKLEKALMIGQAFDEYGQMWEVAMFLQQYGISPIFVNKIYKRYGNATKEILNENPYKLADDIDGIGFKVADKIALNLGFDPSSEKRIASCIKYILLKSAIEQGHTFLPIEKLNEYTSLLLEKDSTKIHDVIISMVVRGEIKLTLKGDTENVYLKSMEQFENSVCKKIIDLSLVEFEEIDDCLTNYISSIEQEQGIILVEEQKRAVVDALKNGVTIITGGPGTGKTTIVNTVVQLLEKMGLTYVLAAPTGRAAKRLSETTNRDAKTIHRMLELGKSEELEINSFSVNASVPMLKEDVVIIDETSMVDITLMYNLLSAISSGTRLIMVGDADQLPAVGPGNVLKDIISSGVIKVLKLTEIFRQSKESFIVTNAHKINHGEYPSFNNKDGDFFIQKNYNPVDVLKNIISLCSERLFKHKGYDPHKDIQVLSPTKKGILGIKNLNNELQKVLNAESKAKKQKAVGETIFRVGDKVMQTKNNYDITWRKPEKGEYGFGVFNGDIGRIIEIDEDIIKVSYEDKVVEYSMENMDELELAYAVTVHKSQGSEFPAVVMPIVEGFSMLTTRNLLYTAITRAREIVVLVGREEGIRKMVDNNHEIQRYSGLADKLKTYRIV